MKNTNVTVWIPEEDFNLFLEVFKIVCDLPNLEANCTFRGKDIRVYNEKHMIKSIQLNIPLMDYIKWAYYHNKNS